MFLPCSTSGYESVLRDQLDKRHANRVVLFCSGMTVTEHNGSYVRRRIKYNYENNFIFIISQFKYLSIVSPIRDHQKEDLSKIIIHMKSIQETDNYLNWLIIKIIIGSDTFCVIELSISRRFPARNESVENNFRFFCWYLQLQRARWYETRAAYTLQATVKI